MTKRMVGAACLWGIAVVAGLVLAAPPSVLPAGATLDDGRPGPPGRSTGIFPSRPWPTRRQWPRPAGSSGQPMR
jgi:hypothetical protein